MITIMVCKTQGNKNRRPNIIYLHIQLVGITSTARDISMLYYIAIIKLAIIHR